MPGVEQPIEFLEKAPYAADVHAQIHATLPGTGPNIDPCQRVLVQPDTNFEIVFETKDQRGAPDPNEAREIIRLEQSPAAALLDEFHTGAPHLLVRNGIGPTDQPRVVGPWVGLGSIVVPRFGEASCEQTATLRGDYKRGSIS